MAQRTPRGVLHSPAIPCIFMLLPGCLRCLKDDAADVWSEKMKVAWDGEGWRGLMQACDDIQACCRPLHGHLHVLGREGAKERMSVRFARERSFKKVTA